MKKVETFKLQRGCERMGRGEARYGAKEQVLPESWTATQWDNWLGWLSNETITKQARSRPRVAMAHFWKTARCASTVIPAGTRGNMFEPAAIIKTSEVIKNFVAALLSIGPRRLPDFALTAVVSTPWRLWRWKDLICLTVCICASLASNEEFRASEFRSSLALGGDSDIGHQVLHTLMCCQFFP